MEGGVELQVHVRPRASRSEVLGVRERPGAPGGATLEVRVAAPPVEGAANEELLATVARALGIPRRDVQLVRGSAGRTKTVRIEHLPAPEVLARLDRAAPPG